MSKLPDQVQISITISDERWPMLKAVGIRSSLSGSPSVVKEEAQYDLAYGKFENMLHNLLRPAVEEIVRTRKGTTKQEKT